MSKEIRLTADGYEKLKRELEELKGPTRSRVAEAIREAKAHGDLRENAAYHEAKLNQTRLDARVQELEKILQIAKVDTGERQAGAIHLGCAIKLKDLDFDDEFTVNLVGSFEADPAHDRISIGSPLGEQLIGKAVGDEVEVEAPAGRQRYLIVGIDG